MSDCDVLIDSNFVDLIDDAWRADKLPEDDIEVPLYELADPEADSGDVHLTLKEQEQKWTDIMLSSLRKQCAIEECQQLDFLPLQCRCGKVFCSEHLRDHANSCINSRFLSEEELRSIENIFICSNDGCKERSVVPLICQRCKKHYCIYHRHLTECEEKSQGEIEREREMYAEPARQFQEAKSVVDKQVENNISEAKKKSKHRQMAAKLQLMKIKNKATGLKSIPAADRVYFNVSILPNSQSSDKTVAVFVSKAWSLGKTIDAVADECRLVNKNNKDTESKLRLFKKDDKHIVSTDLSVIIGNLLSDSLIVDGDDLIIEYVNDQCISL